MTDEPVAWNYNDNNLEPNTITFNNVNSDWVMQITADRKIIVNEDVEVLEAAKAVLDAVQNLLLVPHPVKELTLTDEQINALDNEVKYSELSLYHHEYMRRFARLVLKKATNGEI